ncbi:MAG: autotransporter outer membrane beta-barrel domain-containing protein [Flavobacteriia bacterium]|nr:autotransporter outer membrane beta-barrel domain-containing protein [Flavobacteriia bacterium]
MKNRFFFVLSCFFLSNYASAQNYRIGLGYSFLNNSQWNQTIQLYNDSRPFLEEKQPLLQNGFFLSLDRMLKIENKHPFSLSLAYSFFNSKADNVVYVSKINLHALSFSFNSTKYYLIHKNTPLTFSFGAGIMSNYLERNINPNAALNEDYPIRSLGIGPMLNLNFSYDIALNKGVTISPFVQVSFAPFYYSPGAEKCLNLTQGLMEESWNNTLNIQAGIRFSCIK